MTTDQTLSQIRDFIQSHYQLTLATQGDHPWIATLYYSCDDELQLYFLSSPDTLHCQHIAQNPQVAVAIADTPQHPQSKKLGLQLFGTVTQIQGKQKIIHALTLWKNTLGVSDPGYSYEGMAQKLISGRMYKITPKKIKFFNEHLWEEGSEPVIEL